MKEEMEEEEESMSVVMPNLDVGKLDTKETEVSNASNTCAHTNNILVEGSVEHQAATCSYLDGFVVLVMCYHCHFNL